MKKFLFIVLCMLATLSATAVDTFYINNFTIAPGETKQVEIMLDNTTVFTAIQADIYLPQGLTIVQENGDYIFDLTGRKGHDHSILSRQLSNGAIRIFIASQSLDIISGNSGALVTFNITADASVSGTMVIDIKNIIASDSNQTEHQLPNTSCNVSTSTLVLATGITLNKSELLLEKGDSETLVATVSPSDVTNNSVTWTSSNPSVATVDQNGKVTAMRYGSANITVRTTDGTNLTASCHVKIFSSEQSANTVQVGNGTILSETLPICNYWLNTYCGFESIYLKDEMGLNAGDRITSFSFYCAKNSGKGGIFNVRIKETDLTVFQNPETPTDNHSLLTTDDEVYGRVTLGNYSSGNWITFNLDNPYVYNGKNLIVDIRNSEPGIISMGCYFYCTSAEDKTFLWLQAKNEQASSFYGYDGSSGFHLDDVRPNIRIAYLRTENIIPGDVNGDGVVTAADITALYELILNNDSSHIVNGDQTGDGIVTTADVTAIYVILLGDGK